MSNDRRITSYLLPLVVAALFAGAGCSSSSSASPADNDADEQADVEQELSAEDGVDAVMEDDPEPVVEAEAEPEPDPEPEIEADPERDGYISTACGALTAGMNNDFMVNGEARGFILTLPTGATSPDSGPWPVVFNWHGMGDTASNMAGILSGQVNNAIWPFILVTPEDTNLFLDWDMLTPDPVTNKEARLFDEILECMDQRFGVDWDRVHSVGFSAGGILTDMLMVVRPGVLASTITFSGVYFSNPANVNDGSVVPNLINIQWPDLSAAYRFTQLVSHGGASDTQMGVSFTKAGANDAVYLTGMGNDVLHCNHGGGHTVPSVLQGAVMVRFLKDHPRGSAVSDYREGVPSSFPSYCALQQASSR